MVHRLTFTMFISVTALLLSFGQRVTLAQDVTITEEPAAPAEIEVTEPPDEVTVIPEPFETDSPVVETAAPELTAETTVTVSTPEPPMTTDTIVPVITGEATEPLETSTPTDNPVEADETPTPAAWFAFYQDDFATLPAPFLYSEGWGPSEGGYLRATGEQAVLAASQPIDIADQAIEVRAQLGGGTLETRIREHESGSHYAALWQAGTINLLRGSNVQASIDVPAAADGSWHTLRLETHGSAVTVMLDDAAILTFTEEASLPPGGFSVRATDGVLLDSLLLESTQPINLPAITAEPTESSSEATPEISPSPTESMVVVVPTAVFADDPLEALGAVTEEAQSAAPRLNNAPQLISPQGRVNLQRPPFRWSAVSGADLYQIQVSRAEDFSADSIVIDMTTTKPTYTPVTTQALSEGNYFWRVRTQDLGEWGSFSQPFALQIHLLVSPADGSFSTDTTPALRWNATIGAVDYQLQIATDESFENIIFETITTRTNFTLTNALNFGRYYWRVNINTGAGYDLVSPFFRLLTITPTAPAAPALVSPVGRAFIAHPHPQFIWTPTTATLGSPYRYQLQIATDSRFTAVIVDDIVDTSPYITDVELPDGKFFWRMRTLNFLDSPGAWSRSLDFTVDTTAPAVPLLRDPLNAATITDNTPLLRWNTAAGASRYEVKVYTQGTATTFTATTTRLDYVTPTLVYAEYSWQVRALDAAGNASDWSEARHFVIDSPLTAAPSINRAESDHAILTWSPINGSLAYEIQIARDSKFSPAQMVGQITVDGAVLSYMSEMLPDGVYYWRVRARRSATRFSPWSAASIFTIEQ